MNYPGGQARAELGGYNMKRDRGNASFFNLSGLFDAVKQIPITDICSRYGVELRRGKAKCPFHEDRNPSFSVKGGRWACWAEGISGDGIDLVARLHRISLLDAAKMIAYDYRLPVSDMTAEERFQARLNSLMAKAKRELEARGQNKAYSDLCSLYRAVDKTCAGIKPDELNGWKGDLFHVREWLERILDDLRSPSPEIKQAALSGARGAGWL